MVQPNDKDEAIISCCSTILLLQAYFTQNIVADGQTFGHTKRMNTVRTRSKRKFICKLINKEACISQAATVSIFVTQYASYAVTNWPLHTLILLAVLSSRPTYIQKCANAELQNDFCSFRRVIWLLTPRLSC